MKVETIDCMVQHQLIEKLTEYNEQLKIFGWKGGIGRLIYGCKNHGHIYEEKYGLDDQIKTTPMNCLAVITHENPDLIITLIHRHEYEQFLQLVCKIGMCLEIGLAKFPIKDISEGWK